ncbi:unnamed protein product [Ostreobium quekettii]|uniref:RecQ-mediated genome instability protein 1 n=1 Tax=Ostreobium quekettii TaxID=121088 RepID=A0A8S1JFH8_9CHLO|nr:unnamed protein product [Ostreobium quekettii]
MSLTDGCQRATGLEYRHIPALKTGMPAGTKIAVTDVYVHRGVLLICPQNIEVLGGKVDRLAHAQQATVGKWSTPPGSRRKKGVQERLDLYKEARQEAWAWEEQTQQTQGTPSTPWTISGPTPNDQHRQPVAAHEAPGNVCSSMALGNGMSQSTTCAHSPVNANQRGAGAQGSYSMDCGRSDGLESVQCPPSATGWATPFSEPQHGRHVQGEVSSAQFGNCIEDKLQQGCGTSAINSGTAACGRGAAVPCHHSRCEDLGPSFVAASTLRSRNTTPMFSTASVSASAEEADKRDGAHDGYSTPHQWPASMPPPAPRMPMLCAETTMRDWSTPAEGHAPGTMRGCQSANPGAGTSSNVPSMPSPDPSGVLVQQRTSQGHQGASCRKPSLKLFKRPRLNCQDHVAPDAAQLVQGQDQSALEDPGCGDDDMESLVSTETDSAEMEPATRTRRSRACVFFDSDDEDVLQPEVKPQGYCDASDHETRGGNVIEIDLSP